MTSFSQSSFYTIHLGTLYNDKPGNRALDFTIAFLLCENSGEPDEEYGYRKASIELKPLPENALIKRA